MCHQTAVFQDQEVQKFFRSVERFCRSNLHMVLSVPVWVALADKRTLQDLSATSDGHKESVRGLFRRQGKRYEAYIEQGLPRRAALCVIAHESRPHLAIRAVRAAQEEQADG